MITKRILTFIILFGIGFQLSAQVAGGTYEKLAKLYNAGKFESCLDKADAYIWREDNSKDAEPYLYISMCLIKLMNSDDEEIREDYKGATSQAVKFATRFVKNDKMRELYPLNIDYINTMKKLQKDEIKDNFNEKKYNKAASSAKLYNQLNQTEDDLVLYYIGLNQVMSKNISQGQRNIDNATKGIKNALKSNKLVIDKIIKSSIIDGFMKYTEFLIKESNMEEAKKVISLAKDIFPNDGYIKVQYNVIFK